MWILLGLISAFFLGVYDICKKVSLKENAVIPVLFFSIACSCLIFLPFDIASRYFPETIKNSIFYIPTVSLKAHVFIFIKSVIVLSSWLFAYFAMKHLPITLASPIKATQPIWIVIGALLFMGEKLSVMQATGVIITLISFYLFSITGVREGFSFRNNKWIWFIVLATLTGATSGLYDKYLMKEFHRFSVQVYYTYYQFVLMAIITITLWVPKRKHNTPFQWRWSILFISILLVLADFCYFYALSYEDSLISIISTLRRSGVIIPFLFGAFFYKEKNMKIKIIALTGVITGIFLLFLESI
jgi:transporter family protein